MRLLALLASATLAGAPDLVAQTRCEPAFQPAADTVRQLVAGLGLEGAALIIRLKGRPVCETYLGKFGPETMMPIVSAAKWLSAATVLALVDEGRLRLDDSVSRWLPYFKGDKRAITVRQLLSHTSGLPNYLPCMFQAQLELDDCARQVAEKSKLSARPGSQFAYGGAAYSVAGRVANPAAQRGRSSRPKPSLPQTTVSRRAAPATAISAARAASRKARNCAGRSRSPLPLSRVRLAG